MAALTSEVRPFLRWAGGKQWFIPRLASFLPAKFNNYHEPFLGGGSVFIHLKSQGIIKNRAYLSDSNGDLINAYNIVKRDVNSLIDKLSEHRNFKYYYDELRDRTFRNKVSKAAQFIFLNRTSFNGIYRVNLKGEYNVPYGYKKYGTLIQEDNLTSLSLLFQDCNFYKRDFGRTLGDIVEGDLVFLDPPYTVAHDLNGFIKYNQKIFSWEDQERLKRYVEVVIERGAYFILTNAAHRSISTLYDGIGTKTNLSRFSVIGGRDAKRSKYNELVFHNP